MQKFTKLFLIGLIVLSAVNVFADASIQKVEIAPLTGGVSFNTIVFADRSITGWVTAPSVSMIGRKRLLIQNNSSSNNIYLTGVSGSTAVGTLGSGKVASFAVSAGLNVYVSTNTVETVDIWEIR